MQFATIEKTDDRARGERGGREGTKEGGRKKEGKIKGKGRAGVKFEVGRGSGDGSVSGR